MDYYEAFLRASSVVYKKRASGIDRDSITLFIGALAFVAGILALLKSDANGVPIFLIWLFAGVAIFLTLIVGCLAYCDRCKENETKLFVYNYIKDINNENLSPTERDLKVRFYGLDGDLDDVCIKELYLIFRIMNKNPAIALP